MEVFFSTAVRTSKLANVYLLAHVSRYGMNGVEKYTTQSLHINIAENT